jgi:hypothetical protein
VWSNLVFYRLLVYRRFFFANRHPAIGDFTFFSKFWTYYKAIFFAMWRFFKKIAVATREKGQKRFLKNRRIATF